MARTARTEARRKGSGTPKGGHPLTSLAALYAKQVQDLYSAEQMILQALPQMGQAASSPELQAALQEDQEQTQTHVDRLDRIREELRERPKGARATGMLGLFNETQEIMRLKAAPSVRDGALIAAAQRAEHYEIAGYGCARTYARLLGKSEAAILLQATLEEEKTADRKWTDLAESHINPEAHAAGGQEGLEEGVIVEVEEAA